MKWLFVFLFALQACTATVNRFTVDKVVERGLTVPDLGKVCALGSSLAHMLAATGGPDAPPHLAMVVAESTAATCDEAVAWETELTRLRQPLSDIAAITDARLLEQRAHGQSAARFWRAFQQTEAAFGPIGETCPRIDAEDEVVWILGLVSGMLGVLHDKASGGMNDIPLDAIGRVGRAAKCVDDERWWYVPSALQAASWAIIPGSGPMTGDPWLQLSEAATKGEKSGVRVARAIEVMVAANADRTTQLQAAIKAHKQSIDTVPRAARWALFDEYARLITLHQNDVVWTIATRHRAPSLGSLPTDTTNTAPPPNPFE